MVMDREKKKRFDNVLAQKDCDFCYRCMCYEGCQSLPDENPLTCDDILFIYLETGETENFEKFSISP